MKLKHYIILLCCGGLFSCNKIIDLNSESNLNTSTYYSNTAEVKSALTGCYNGLQSTLYNEWRFTELRSDNAKMGVTGSTSNINRELSDLDMFIPSPSMVDIFNYWRANYNNIRNCNIILQKLGVVYNPANGTIAFNAIDIPITEVDRKQLAGEAMFIRAYHYFNWPITTHVNPTFSHDHTNNDPTSSFSSLFTTLCSIVLLVLIIKGLVLEFFIRKIKN